MHFFFWQSKPTHIRDKKMGISLSCPLVFLSLTPNEVSKAELKKKKKKILQSTGKVGKTDNLLSKLDKSEGLF